MIGLYLLSFAVNSKIALLRTRLEVILWILELIGGVIFLKTILVTNNDGVMWRDLWVLRERNGCSSQTGRYP